MNHTTAKDIFTLFCKKSLIALLFLFLAGIKALSGQTDTLRLLFVGDIMGHGAQIKSAETSPGNYDYRPCFKYVKPLIEQADLAFGNLELTLPGKPPYKGYPMFRSPDQLADALKDAGFDVLTTANNHSNDSRGAGVTQTIETLRNRGFWQTGTFANTKERSAFYPLMLYENGFKLAVLNYTYGTNGIPTEAPTIVNLLDTVQIAKDLAEAKARKPHFIIVITHWGLEYQLTENAEQRAMARFLIRNGADLIVGAHPHVVQPVKEEQVGDKKVVVAYSLGNYISNQTQPHTDGGIMFQVELLHHKGVPRAEVGRYGYIPVYRYIHQPVGKKPTYFTLPIDRMEQKTDLFPDMSTASRQKMSAFGTALKKRLGTATAW
jgi:poly-gamma-glutamate capsule biosynthesis protein CapA/YwtB (metallophosphatase superfamily)